MEPTAAATESSNQAQAEQEPSLRTIIKGVCWTPAPLMPKFQTSELPLKNDLPTLTYPLSRTSSYSRVSITRQQDIFRRVGYHYDWDHLAAYWHFLGKMAAKAMFNDEIKLDVLNYVPLGRREFIAYTTPMWAAAVKAREAEGQTGPPSLSVVKANFKKPVPRQPLEMSWAPARSPILAQIRRWNEDSGGEEDNSELSD